MKKISSLIFPVFVCITVVMRIVGAEFVQQTSQYLMTRWTTERGLPQNTVTAILQARNGYLWIATFGGLARFDGVKFTDFTPVNTPVLKDNRYLSLYEDAEGILWISSEYGNIYYYENKSFHQLEFADGSQNNFFKERDEYGNVLIANKQGFVKYRFERGKQLSEVVEIYPASTLGLNILPNRSEFRKESIWVISNQNKLFEINRANRQITDLSEIIGNKNVIKIVRDKLSGGLWLVNNDSVGRLIGNQYATLFTFDKTLTGFDVSLFPDRENNFWVITREFLLKFSGANVEKFPLDAQAGFNLRCMTIDSENNFWVGTNENGLYRIKRKRISVYGRIVDDHVEPATAVYEDSTGTVWIGTNGLLSVKDEKTQLEWEKGALPQENAIGSINQDKNGALWYSTRSHLNKITPNGTQKFENPEINGKKPFVRIIFFDSQNNLWAGTNDGLALISGGQTKTFSVEQGLVNNWILNIAQTRNGDIWIGTIGGISRYRDGTFTNFTTNEGLSSNSVRDMFEDVDGTLWIGTYGGGINRFRDGKFLRISSLHGLPEDIASSILLDNNDRFWILGNRGIYNVSRQMLNEFADGKIPKVIASLYDTGDGMITSEGNGINQYSGWKAKDGSLWFTMINGVVRIDPKQQTRIPPKIYIEEVFVDRQKINSENPLEISYGQANIEIHYTGVNLSKPENVQFRYRLENLENDWNIVGKRRTAYFSYLPPGKYVFKVEAISASGVLSDNDAVLTIIVKAPFWQTLWFYTTIFLLTFFLIIFIFQLRLRKIQNERLQQRRFSAQLIKAHEAERKRIASDLHDGLGQNLLVIKNWAIIALKNLTDTEQTRTHLEEISTFAGNALEDSRNIAQNLMPLHLKRFGLTKTIQNMLDRITKAANIEIESDLDPFDNLLTEEYELGIYRIVQECLNNMVKHSQTSKALVSLKNKTGIIKIIIKDYGKGFDAGEQISAQTKQIGFGLYNLVERVKLMNGKIDIRSKPDEGTEVEIEIKI